LIVGTVRGRGGERRLVEIEISEARPVEPILQGALAALPLRDATKLLHGRRAHQLAAA
jgi:hypothetical protein